jgi:hypothetical protein
MSNEPDAIQWGIRVEIRRYVDDAYPGWVECCLTDVSGRDWFIVEKVPVVTLEDIGPETVYPRRTVIACEVVERQAGVAGREIVIIDTEHPWHIAATNGETQFAVRPEQLELLNSGAAHKPLTPDRPAV